MSTGTIGHRRGTMRSMVALVGMVGWSVVVWLRPKAVLGKRW
ncbi:MAG: hypothetical protein ABSA16_15455 [Thermoguttaceae bacterium]